MSIPFDKATTVREIVTQYPQTRGVFEQFEIDYCCGASNSLATAAAQRGLDLESLVSALQEAIGSPTSDSDTGADWSAEPATRLAEYIIGRHHSFLKEQLPRLEQLIANVLEAHRLNHGDMLARLQRVFDSLRWEIEEHMLKEEQILFPYIREIEAYSEGKGDKPVVHCGTIQNPIRVMEMEHQNAGEALAEMRRITSDYRLPEDACESFRTLYEGLQALDADLHEHIHLENNILFPKGVQLEASAGLGWETFSSRP